MLYFTGQRKPHNPIGVIGPIPWVNAGIYMVHALHSTVIVLKCFALIFKLAKMTHNKNDPPK